MSLQRRLGDSFDICLMVVAGMPVVSAVAAASVTWWPLGYLAGVAGAVMYRRILRTVRRRFVPPDPDAGVRAVRQPKLWWYVRLALLAAVLSVPVAQVFFRGDLHAMATPFVAAEASGQPLLLAGIPESIYGPSPGIPSYTTCQWIQGVVGTAVSEPCYSVVGYLRLWQMPTALPTMLCIALLYIGIPIAVALYSPQSAVRRAQPRVVGPSKGSK
ncbi:hypothetical protein [Prescottella subtropica]|uniref:hypothetical protein n=1 Tax=Prescottella subtropica TaxID=2545757 RepID=UPI001386AAA5|nr:hypothetical protein [Prescottella subtropica]